MRWPPNPYAIAERLSGKVLGTEVGARTADDLLVSLFNDSARGNLERLGIKTFDEVLRFFARISELHDKPITAAAARKLPLIQDAANTYGEEAIEKLLPYLLPISDAQFSGESTTPPANGVLRLSGSYADTGPLITGDISYLDPKQGPVNDCYLIAAMIALAWSAAARFANNLQASGYDPAPPSHFTWHFHESESERSSPVTVTGRVPQENGVPDYAKSETPGEFWPSLVEKAYLVRAMRRRARRGESVSAEPTPADYLMIGNYEKPWHACRQLAGGVVTPRLHHTDLHAAVFLSNPEFFNSAGKATLPLMARTKEINRIAVSDRIWETFGLFPNHAYAILGKMRNSNHVVLRNPLGHPTRIRDGYFDGPPWDCGEQNPVNINQSGVFAIEPALFNKYFQWAGWVRFS